MMTCRKSYLVTKGLVPNSTDIKQAPKIYPHERTGVFKNMKLFQGGGAL
jgi:hypothetical protein